MPPLRVNIGPRGLYLLFKMTCGTTIDEATVVLEAQQGDRAAFGELVRQYQKRAYAIAYGFVGNREDALEIAQEAFVRAYRGMNRFDTKMPFYPWLYRIVKNTCLNHIKKRRRRAETSLDGLMQSGFDVPSTDPGPRKNAVLSDLRRAIAGAIDQLGNEHREIITLRHIHEQSYQEIALCLGIPKGTVMSRLHAARKALRKILERNGQPESVKDRGSSHESPV